jgi:hypothetical protein
MVERRADRALLPTAFSRVIHCSVVACRSRSGHRHRGADRSVVDGSDDGRSGAFPVEVVGEDAGAQRLPPVQQDAAGLQPNPAARNSTRYSPIAHCTAASSVAIFPAARPDRGRASWPLPYRWTSPWLVDQIDWHRAAARLGRQQCIAHDDRQWHAQSRTCPRLYCFNEIVKWSGETALLCDLPRYAAGRQLHSTLSFVECRKSNCRATRRSVWLFSPW